VSNGQPRPITGSGSACEHRGRALGDVETNRSPALAPSVDDPIAIDASIDHGPE
jgi:hypothetical protein